MTAQIVVGFNATASSAEAVMWAANEAVAQQRALCIVTCVEMPMFVGDPMLGYPAADSLTSLQATCNTTAAAMADVVADAHPGLTVTRRSSADPPAGVLLRGLDVDDLVVVGASRHDGVAAFVLGSTTRHVVRHSPCPVAVIRGAASRGGADRIVVGVDGSPASDVAVRWASDEADRHDVELVIVHGWSYPYPPDDSRSTQARELTQVDAACMLERSVDVARTRCRPDVTARLVEASPVSALLETVRDGDFLVMGSRGRGALRSRLFGSTVNSVLETSAVPVIVVRTDGDMRPPATAAARRDVIDATPGTEGASDLATIG